MSLTECKYCGAGHVCHVDKHTTVYKDALRRVLALAQQWEDGMRAMGYQDGKHEGATAIRVAIGDVLECD